MRMPFLNRSARKDSTGSQPVPNQPIEVGTVSWQRELDDALALAAQTSKPVFALFQEVPGCAGCQQFGADVLSDPNVVDAIESEFVPLLIHNNSAGRDAEVLALYREPAWNFQVVRFLDATGADIIERRDRVWQTGPLVERILSALTTAGRPVPDYLRLLGQQHSSDLQTAFIAQSCFWVGEAELGRLDGVVTTEAGFMHGHEVTRVEFDPTVTSLSAVVKHAVSRDVATAVFADEALLAELQAEGPAIAVGRASRYRVAPISDQKRQIRNRLDLTGLSKAQVTKLNAFAPTAIAAGAQYLPPRRRANIH